MRSKTKQDQSMGITTLLKFSKHEFFTKLAMSFIETLNITFLTSKIIKQNQKKQEKTCSISKVVFQAVKKWEVRLRQNPKSQKCRKRTVPVTSETSPSEKWIQDESFWNKKTSEFKDSNLVWRKNKIVKATRKLLQKPTCYFQKH